MKLLFRYDPESGAVTIYTSRAPYFRLQMSSSDVTRFLGALPPKPQHPLLTHLRGSEEVIPDKGPWPDSTDERVLYDPVTGELLPNPVLRHRPSTMEKKK